MHVQKRFQTIRAAVVIEPVRKASRTRLVTSIRLYAERPFVVYLFDSFLIIIVYILIKPK